MEVIRVDLPEDIKELEIIPISDVHLGDAQCAYKQFMSVIDYIKTTPNAYCILNGDLMDSAVKSSIGDIYSATIMPMEQLEQCVKIFADIKDKILCVLPGNHEARIYKQDGIDMTELMCSQLGISERCSKSTVFLFLRFGYGYKGIAKNKGRKDKMCYTLYCTHGSGGGRREGGKINRLADLAQIADADIYICGHTHLPAVFKESYYRSSPANSTVCLVDRLFVNNAAYLEYGGYGDIAGFKPASNSSPRIILSGTEKSARAIV